MGRPPCDHLFLPTCKVLRSLCDVFSSQTSKKFQRNEWRGLPMIVLLNCHFSIAHLSDWCPKITQKYNFTKNPCFISKPYNRDLLDFEVGLFLVLVCPAAKTRTVWSAWGQVCEEGHPLLGGQVSKGCLLMLAIHFIQWALSLMNALFHCFKPFLGGTLAC